jgi:hypothetical protein
MPENKKDDFGYVYVGKAHPDRKGQRCRGCFTKARMWSSKIEIEFQDGTKIIGLRPHIRKAKE